MSTPIRLVCIVYDESKCSAIRNFKLDGWSLNTIQDVADVKSLASQWPCSDSSAEVEAALLTLQQLDAIHWRDVQHFCSVQVVVFVFEPTEDWRNWLPVVHDTSDTLPALVLPGPLAQSDLQLAPQVMKLVGSEFIFTLGDDRQVLPLSEVHPIPKSLGEDLCLPSMLRVHVQQAGLGEIASSVFARAEPPHEGDFIYRVAEPFISASAREMVEEALSTRTISSSSAWPFKLQDELSRVFGVVGAQACANGHDALVLALASLGIGSGDDVLIPTWTFVAVLNAVAAVGANPILVDMAKQDYNPGIDDWRAAATPRTRALICCYTFGVTCNVDEILSLCKEKCWYFIEDISEAIGCRWRGHLLGSFGDVAACSLFANKLVTAGDGGFCLTNSQKLQTRLAALTAHGGNFGFGKWRFVHPELGFNCKLNGLAAVLALAAVPEIEKLCHHRREIAQWYTNELQGLVSMMPYKHDHAHAFDVPWLFGIHVESVQVRDDLRAFLALKKVETRSYFLPIHLQPSYEMFVAQTKRQACASGHYSTSRVMPRFPHSEHLGGVGLNLPTHAYLAQNDVKYIASAVADFFGHTRQTPQKPDAALPPFFSFDETTRVTCTRDFGTQTIDLPRSVSPPMGRCEAGANVQHRK